ncbi:MAG TPA: 4Fe-4S binding protein [Kiritimatiellia bacterium]|nr:4Fe-4S binding protein [Kiritimatiellia bacterium]HNS81027.1 4Fe-4S binding protein [Kiritimatiellia bacterium]
MLKVSKVRLQQGYRTMKWPDGPAPEMPPHFTGRPVISGDCCNGCGDCAKVCPTGAIAVADGKISLDTGLCIFCGKCEKACSKDAIKFGNDFRLASAKREDLVVQPGNDMTPNAYSEAIHKLFGRSLKLRQVSAGGCNACEADTNVLGTLAWDLGRFGIQFVASPRHADGILVTGPVSKNMELALKKTCEAVPAPKIVIAVGACAVSGGIYRGQEETHKGVAEIIPVDLFIPGCPPHPATILDGLLRLLRK